MLTYDLQAGDQPKYYRLYTCIREDILRAELLPGQKLPSKRALAEHLHISLATVSGAYEQLVDEGYLTAKPRSGYYVSAISRLPSGSAAQPRLRMLPADDAAWQPLRAIEEGRYYEIPSMPYNWLSNPPSLNMLLGVWWLGNLLYPQYYAYDMVEKTQEMFRLLWNYDLTAEDARAMLANSTLKGAS